MPAPLHRLHHASVHLPYSALEPQALMNYWKADVMDFQNEMRIWRAEAVSGNDFGSRSRRSGPIARLPFRSVDRYRAMYRRHEGKAG